VIAIAAASQAKTPLVIAAAGEHAAAVPPYLDVGIKAPTARLTRLPERSEIPVLDDERPVVEFYSR
jgi:small subunit ribosomal protein S4